MRLLTFGSSILLLTSIVFGGGTRHGLFSDFIPEILSLPILLLIVLYWHAHSLHFGWGVALITAIFAVYVIQLLPLPVWIWSMLPGRSDLATQFESLGIQNFNTTLSLRPSETLRSAFALFPALAIYLASPFLSLNRRVKLVLALAAFVFVSILIGFLQILGGAESGLYFYDVTNIGRAVGLFANANHFTALLYASLPLVLAVFAERSDHILSRPFVMLGVVTFIWLVGLSISGSRSALILGGLSLGLSFLLFVRHVIPASLSRRGVLLSAILICLVILPVLSGVGLATILNRLETQDITEDARAKILPLGLDLVLHHLPLGSGFGTFQEIYAQQEPSSAVMPAIVNHAHNDFLELAIEGGLPAILLLLVWLVFLFRQIATLLPRHNDLEGRLAKAALISIALLTLHSLWDYPLRTIALSSLFALASGFLFPAPRRHQHEGQDLKETTVWRVMGLRSLRRGKTLSHSHLNT